MIEQRRGMKGLAHAPAPPPLPLTPWVHKVFQAMLRTAMADLRNSNRRLRDQAIAWVIDRSTAPSVGLRFVEVCRGLGYDPVNTRRAMLLSIGSDCVRVVRHVARGGRRLPPERRTRL